MAAWRGQETWSCLPSELLNVCHGHGGVSLYPPRSYLGLWLFPSRSPSRYRVLCWHLIPASHQCCGAADQDTAIPHQPCTEMLPGKSYQDVLTSLLTRFSLCRCITSVSTSGSTTSPLLNTRTSLPSFSTPGRQVETTLKTILLIISLFQAFMWTASGQNEFQNLLSSLRRTKSCKKDLWAKITAAVQNTNLPGLSTQQQ